MATSKRSRVQDETPVWAAMQGSKRLGEMNRGWGIARTRAENSLAAHTKSNRAAVRRWNAER